jgi:hypothetical protein
MKTYRRTATLIAAVAVILPASADASSVGRFASEGGGFQYTAHPGETNDVTVTRDGTGVLIDDPGAVIRPFGSECAAVNEHRVRCADTFPNEFGEPLSIDLGDGNDKARLGDSLKPVLSNVSLDGDQGDDELSGSESPNNLAGGPGSDKLTAGAGTSGLSLAERLSFDDKAGPRWITQPDQATCAAYVPEFQGQTRTITADGSDTVDGSCGTPQIVTSTDPVDAPKGSKGKCEKTSRKKGYRIEAKSKYGVVFQKQVSTGGFRYYGCLFNGGKISMITSADAGGFSGGGQNKPVMNGRYVAFATRGTAIGDEVDRLNVWDLRNGFTKFQGGGPFISKIVVKKNGSVAWISTSQVAGSGDHEVHRISDENQDEGNVVLERSGTITTTSLKLEAGSNSISWVSGGETKTAELR